MLVCDRLEEENVVVSVLGTFAKLQKVTINFVMPVHLSFCLHGIPELPLDGI